MRDLGPHHRDVCRGEGCNCCKVCGDHRFTPDGVCIICHPYERKPEKPRARTPRVSNKSIAAAREKALYEQERGEA